MQLFFRRFPARGGLQLFALLCALMAGTQSLHAVTIVVTNTADSGPGSLRAAIGAASNGDTIQFDPALNGQSINLTGGELTIDKNITIDGPGADQLAVKKASGSPAFRIFHVLLGHSFILRNLTIDGNGTRGAGLWNDYASVALDGCVVQGCFGDGGIRCFASFNDDSYLTIINSIIRNNQADMAGGGIYNSACCSANLAHALIMIRGSVISNNTVVGISGNAAGGGIWNSGEIVINDSIVSDNVSGGNGPNVPFGNGGGISNHPQAGSLYIFNSTISGNSAGFNGGGIYNVQYTLLSGSTVSGNTANGINDLEGWGDGGGLYNGGASRITNSTLSNNDSTRSGGAVSNRGNLIIDYSTFSGNIAFEGGTIANYNGATLQLANTALKVSTFSPGIYNNSGTITSNGYNLISDNGGGFFTGPGDQTNKEPMLGPLQNNGGLTFTHELLTGSPAIDAGNPSFAPPPANDQRGSLYLRVFNGRLDIGSLEVQPAPPTPTPTVTPTPTATATATATVPPSPTATATATATPTATVPATPTPFGTVDLVLTKTDSPDPVQVGNNLTYTITIANTSIRPAFNVQMSDTLPAGVTLVSAIPSQGSCAGTSTISCNLADIVGEHSATVTLVVTPTAAGTLTNTATCTTTSQEFNLSNNSDTELTTVNPASTPTPTPTATPTPTPTPTAGPPPAAQALQLSTRMLVQTANNVGIGGFIITGTAPKHVLLRAIGSTLSQFGVPNALADPVLELHGPTGFVTIINDNCEDGQIPSSLCTPGSGNAGIETTLDPGAYTAIVKGKNNTTGVALVEVYDLNQGVDSRLANLSTRAFVGTGADIVIAGVLLGGNSGSDTVVVRGMGPSLANVGVPNPLANPRLELRDENGTLIASSDDWQADPICMLCKLGFGYLGPPNPLEAALLATLPPGAYTALLSGVNNGTGVGLVEIYDRVGQP